MDASHQALKYAEPSDWSAYQATITRLYIDENKTLKEVIRIMQEDFQFRAT